MPLNQDGQLAQDGRPAVAIFASAYYPTVGGVQEVVRQLSHYRAARGLRSLVITNRWPKDLPAKSLEDGVQVRRYVFRVPEHNIKQMTGATLFSLPTLAAICSEIRKLGAQAINVHCVSSNAYYALLARRAMRLPLIVSLHGELTVDSTALFERSPFARKLMLSALDGADAITACSQRTLDDAEAFYGKPFGDRAEVIYSGVNVHEFQGVEAYGHGRPYILAVGRLERSKGFDLLLRAFKRITEAGDATADLLIAGDGTEDASLRRLVSDLGLGERVRFLGRTDRATIARLFAGCLFFVLPSRIEPMGIVSLEAMSAGKSVIAANVGGVPELVEHEVSGLLVAPDDESALAGAIGRLLGSAALRERLAAGGAERVGSFDWSVSATRYCRLYDEAILSHGLRAGHAPSRSVLENI